MDESDKETEEYIPLIKRKGRPPTAKKVDGKITELLSKDQRDEAIEHLLQLKHYDLLHSKLGFKTRREFFRYLRANPEFEKELEAATVEACKSLRDDALDAAHDMEPAAARVKIDAIHKRLAFLDPAKYGNKIDVNMNQTISIRSSIEAGNARIAELLRDVTPPLLPPKKD